MIIMYLRFRNRVLRFRNRVAKALFKLLPKAVKKWLIALAIRMVLEQLDSIED